jgi:uncharacterized LabA/DUF88 family protein
VSNPNLGRPTRVVHPEPLVFAPNAALLIDFDNVTMGIRSDLQNQLRRLLSAAIFKGKVSVQRAYADWRRYPQYIVPLSEASIDLIFAPAFGSNKKNATDIRLAIDALELVFTRPEIGTFILLSGDSDFSSLVLKLKEYAKYVIGVGIRESSSDLLIQNCDEYYSYNELTGLTKEGEVEIARRDPWELVVDAVVRMRKENDVMRSDRLKQVMQEIDPNFDEKEAGFNRFSKFVMEAGRRGLLSLAKLDNGQYAIDVGHDANVPPGEEAEFKKRDQSPSDRPGRAKRRRPERRRESGGPQPLALAEAFELLKQALLVLGAVGEQATDAEQAKDEMVRLLGEATDPLFDGTRFKRFLRQAHDANLIDLAKQDDDVYLLKLRPEAVTADTAPAPEAAPPETGGDGDDGGEEEAARKRSASRRGGRTRGRGGRARKEGGPEPEPKGRDRDATAQPNERARERQPAPAVRGADAGDAAGSKRNPRFRRGSRGAPPGPTGTAAAREGSPTSETATVEARPPQPHGARSLGHRSGRSPRSSAPAGGGARVGGPDTSAPPPPSPPPAGERTRTERSPERAPARPAPEPRVEKSVDADVAATEDGLLKRMSAVFQRMVGPGRREEP